ncbi:MAG: hypothetical protein QOE97_1878 [Pseudonocardiales bacterium]|nr:hypothetical protein [Pseudonocardiales bacterium]
MPSGPGPVLPPAQPDPALRGRDSGPWVTARDLRTAAVLIAGLAALGALLGVIWWWWSPPGPLGFVVAPHAVQPDEVETFAATDGRFAVLTGATGLITGTLLWLRRSSRGPVVPIAMALGGLAGALLTDAVGRALDNGTGTGPPNTVLSHLPLQVHQPGLWLFEPLLAVLVYGICAAFAAEDGLGRDRSVGVRDEAQHGGRDRDGAGALHEADLPAQ